MSSSDDKRFKVIIPARGGSKGVPRKNIRVLNGLPLIAYPIRAAQKSKYVSEIYVSTDDQEIAETAKKYGATIIQRPTKYATDAALDIDVIRQLSISQITQDVQACVLHMKHLRLHTSLLRRPANTGKACLMMSTRGTTTIGHAKDYQKHISQMAV